ncbi:MAG: dicarboxylate/amino acid:cation symporter [Bacilli bacterium]|nr:dicarboxylate/amino acid:cation symporter [Bacilli bacterium]MDD4809344.1 dicarboxylate/amino acid:cation symporter [Bacilli bacterium]
MRKFLKTYHFSIILFISIIIGSIIGLIMKEDALVLKPFGDIFLNLMFTIVVPLVFVTISSGVANMINLKRLGKILFNLLFVFLATGIVAAIFMLIIVKIYNPALGSNVVLEAGESISKINIGERIVQALTVTDFSHLLSRSNMLPLIIFSILFGIGISALGKQSYELAKLLNTLSEVMMRLVKYIMYYAPIGLCAYFATLIGQFGPELIGGYAKAIILYIVAAIIYYLVFYTLYAYISAGKDGIKAFYRHILPPTATALATQSSLASLPTNLDAAKKIGIPKDIREVVLPIGTTMNMHGSVIGSVLKISFLFTIFDKPFTGLDTYAIAIIIAVLSGVVMSGIPGGGLIGEMLVVSLYDFPPAAFIVASTIGLLIDAPATALNVVDDISASMLVTRITEGKNWLKNKLIKE